MKKVIITLFIIFTLFGCAEEQGKETYVPEKEYISIYGEITSEFSTKDISNWYFQESDGLLRCGYFGSGSTKHNSAMIQYAANLLNDNVTKDVPDAYIDICTGERYSGASRNYTLSIEIANTKDNTTYYVYYKDPVLRGYEKQLINQAIEHFKNDPTASFFGEFYVEIN